MPEAFVASTQYHDLKGTVEADGFDSDPLHKFAELTDMPEDYFPVGVSFSGTHVRDGKIGFTLIAVRKDESGPKLEEWEQYAAVNGKLPAYQFEGDVKLTDFPRLFKRLSIKMMLKYAEPLNVEVQDYGER